ncbi:SpvB/TcaC N-terminal domain-containing protein [Nocardia sp. NPDC127606]|uniref:SpvB/TcaC N-terminal domain-containing protein n=1 Tax=Nocardia sp. NPDC127606 TaxID=3345406 RepID=UPI00362A79C3
MVSPRATGDGQTGIVAGSVPPRQPAESSDARSTWAPSTPTLNLPKGGGAIRGLGEKFGANAALGTAGLTVPLPVSPARSGATPVLSLSYDSAAGSGPFGLGWRLATPQLTRKTSRGVPRYDDTDVFVLAGSDDLVPAVDAVGEPVVDFDSVPGYRISRYRPRVEGAFTRIEQWTHTDDGDTHWRALSPDNVLTVFGRTAADRISDPTDGRVFSWLISETRDVDGNAVEYRYTPEDTVEVDTTAPHERNRPAPSANRYLKCVRYGNRKPLLDQHGRRPVELTALERANAEWMFELVFDYGDHSRQNPLPEPDLPWAARTDPFSTYLPGFAVRTYRLCQRVLMFHHFAEESAVGADCLVASMELAYTVDRLALLTSLTHRGYLRRTEGSYDSDTLPPLQLEYTEAHLGDTVLEVDPGSLQNVPSGLDASSGTWVDLYGDGACGILTEHRNAWYYKQNLGGGRFAAQQRVAERPQSAQLDAGRQALLDVTGDGRADLVQLEGGAPGFAAGVGDGWAPFVPFPQAPALDWRGTEVQWVDLTGDGLADLLVSEADAFTWYRSLGAQGFAEGIRVVLPSAEERGPQLVRADKQQALYFADMSGDGLFDLVRVRAAQICYWPNLGHGRFGGQILMSRCPLLDLPEAFDARNIRLADIDGSACTDLLYLGQGRATVWFNEAGNGWSDPVGLAPFPHLDNLATVSVVDLFGAGTACLIWSTPAAVDAVAPLRYLDLMAAGPPRLLRRVANSMGAETTVTYAPSTKFAIADQLAGHPWLTRLPFPVHVVERVQARDRVNGTRTTSHYTYHHGYFDGTEREFRGFARVEQSDTEAFEDFVVGVDADGGHQELAPEFFQPPVTTRSWFHTGVFLDGEDLTTGLGAEFYNRHPDLDGHEFPAGLSTTECRDAVRALKGLPLRVETYSFDGTSAAEHPYSVAEYRYAVRTVQPGVFQSVGIESLTAHYDREPDEPRIHHTCVLETGRFGEPLATATVDYGRRHPDPALPPQVRTDQAKTWIAAGQTEQAPEIDVQLPVPAYRLPAPCETRSYELTAVTPTATLFTIDELATALTTAGDIDYAAESGPGLARRILHRTLIRYRGDDLTALPFGQQGSLGLSFESYRLAFTQPVIEAYYPDITEADWVNAGYRRVDGEDGWWIPSGTAEFGTDPAAHFHLPIGIRDPFGVRTTITRDPYDLLAQRIEIVGAAWNTTSAVNDYRILGQVEVTDANGNRSAVRHDALGLVVRTAVMGKAGSGEGDTLDDPTTRVEYDLTRWANTGRPNLTRVLARENFGATNTGWRESFAYASGSGAVALMKTQAPGGWLATGRTIVNNKGNPVKQYEPYFSPSSEYDDFEALATVGVTPLIAYDPLGRVTRVDLPDGTFTTVETSPWRTDTADANDTVLDSHWYIERGSPDPADPEPADPERRAAWLAARHANTPEVVHADALGRPVFAVADYGGGTSATVRSIIDLTGRRSSVIDQLGRQVGTGFTSMLGVPVFGDSAERGSRWTFTDIRGGLVRSWDSSGREFRADYDSLRRPVSLSVRHRDGHEHVLHCVIYGDRHPDALARNLNGIPHQTFDQAGVVTVHAHAFSGEPTSVSRGLTTDPTTPPDWRPVAVAGTYAAAQTAADMVLDPADTFTASATHDALGRPITLTLPDGTVLTPTYDRASRLDNLRAQLRGTGPAMEFLAAQTYNAKGQRLRAEHGNGLTLTYGYHPTSLRLTDIATAANGTSAASPAVQNMHYTYDPVGNVTQIADAAQQTHFFANSVVSADTRYEYDAFYQLISASGRESAAGNDTIRGSTDLAAIIGLPHVNDANAVRRYTERYDYDLAGNLTRLRHHAPVNGGGWTRNYRYRHQFDPTDTTNRLAATSLPGDPDTGPYTQTYDYDGHGNFSRLRTPNPGELLWNALDQLQQVDLGGGGTAYYNYGADGTRIRKVIERPSGLRQERIYLGALEIYRELKTGTGPTLVRQTLHITDDAGRIAQVDIKLVDTATIDPDNPVGTPIIRYQYSNHLGSATLETDHAGSVLSYEEYHPFGTTAYRSVKSAVGQSLKRYRFSGKERDDETGLFYIGARYYASWLGRWTSPDPAGYSDGLNLWRYCRNSPAVLSDPTGHDPDERPVHISCNPTGNETINDLQAWASQAGLRIDTTNLDLKHLKEHHFRTIRGSGQWFGFSFLPLGAPAAAHGALPPPSIPAASPEPPPKAPPGTKFEAAAKAGRAAYKNANPMPPGTQPHHWTKERSAQAADIDPGVMNQNMSALQSHTGGRPTTLLVPRKPRSTVTYTVEGTPELHTEHKFADNRMIPIEEQKLAAANPSLNPGTRAIEAGRMARWRMTGEPGPAPGPGYGQAVPLNQVLKNLPPVFGTRVARLLVAGFAEAEVVGIFAHSFVTGTLGITSGPIAATAEAVSAAPTSFAITITAAAYGGAMVGNTVESLARSGGVSAEMSIGAAVIGAAATGAVIGTLIPIPAVGPLAGALIGGAAGAIGYGLSKLLF